MKSFSTTNLITHMKNCHAEVHKQYQGQVTSKHPKCKLLQLTHKGVFGGGRKEERWRCVCVGDDKVCSYAIAVNVAVHSVYSLFVGE